MFLLQQNCDVNFNISSVEIEDRFVCIKGGVSRLESLGPSGRNLDFRPSGRKSSFENFVNYSWKIVVYQSHPLIVCV